jgi:type II restriction/modification system DNA methylase subunit YeeA
MTPPQFIAKWQKVKLSERSACQQHFLDLCELLDHPTPAAADPEGTSFTFERGCRKTDGGNGWADVWKRGFFGWEYKGRHKDLDAAYNQLLLYREALENPPLLVVCDMDRFEVHTNFTRRATQVYRFDLGCLGDPASLDTLRKVFFDPDALSPDATREKITEEAAKRVGELADGMRLRGIAAQRAGHFLMKLVFCMFSERIGLLPAGLFTRLVEVNKVNPAALGQRLESLFATMARGGPFGEHDIAWFNGGLFADAQVVSLTQAEALTLAQVAKYDWASIEPSIFGTLFERILDPDKRSQIGAHYTSRRDIETLLTPVLMAPLRREWEEVMRQCEGTLFAGGAAQKPRRTKSAIAKPSAGRKKLERTLLDFAQRLAHVSVLDPACGSGNFLYVALHMLLDLEKEVVTYANNRGVSIMPQVSPTQLHGLEINESAQQLAQVAIWIGYLQWMHYNGFKMPDHPVLAPIESVRCTDAILDLSDPEHPKEPEWPEAEFIVGNPPFLGDKKMRRGLGDRYVDELRTLYLDRLPGQSDLCCFWFEKARAQLSARKCVRAGLLATQNIRGGASREVLHRISETGGIFFAVSDREWILDGAIVHISMIGFDNGTEKDRLLDGVSSQRINANLSSGTDTTESARLKENARIGFIGSCKGGSFDISEEESLHLIQPVGNPHGRPNSDVVRPVMNSRDLLGRNAQRWIIDNADLELAQACLYEGPHAIVEQRVKPGRDENRDDWLRQNWWRPQRMRPEMRMATAGLERFLVTPTTSKHRLFAWLAAPTLPDHKLVVFARADDYFFGVLHSRAHELWCRVQGTQLRERESALNYNVQTSFESFPLPEAADGVADAIAEEAKKLDDLRSAWLNPPEWTRTEVLEFPGSLDGPWRRYIDPTTVRPLPGSPHPNPLPAREGTYGIGTVRWPRTVPKDPDCAASLKQRTLTNLYNQRPTWLVNAHRRLDAAASAAYGWDPGLSDEELLERLLRLNLERAAK